MTPLLLHIEQPLRDATHVVEALRLVGYGLILHDEAGGDAVAALAHIAAERLQVVEEKWNEVVEARQRGKRSGSQVGLSAAAPSGKAMGKAQAFLEKRHVGAT